MTPAKLVPPDPPAAPVPALVNDTGSSATDWVTTDGRITVCGHDVVEQPFHAQSAIGYLPEGAPGYGEMTPWSFLSFIAEIRGTGEPERVLEIGAGTGRDRSRAQGALLRVPLPPAWRPAR